MSIVIADLKPGQEVGRKTLTFNRMDLVRYAGSSGDFNPIHYNDTFAKGVGLPNVIMHGMLTMGAGIEVVVEWLGDPGRVRDYSVRFTKPVIVPADMVGAKVEVAAKVAAVDAEAGTARIDIVVMSGGTKILTKSQVTIS